MSSRRKVTTSIIGINNDRYSIVIPSAGAGHRMRSYGPKSLIKIDGNTTIIDRQLDIIKKIFTNCEIILVTGFCADKLMNHTPSDLIKVENENYENTNVLRSIGIGLRAATTDKVLILYGDLVFNEEAIKNLKLDSSAIVVDSSGLMGELEVGCNISNGKVHQLLPDMPNKWGQMLFLTDKELTIFKKISYDKNKGHYFGFEAINETIDRGGKFEAVHPKEMKITDVDSSKDFVTVKKII